MTPTTLFCQECGAALLADSQFCEGCGIPIASGLTNFTRVRELFDQAMAVDVAHRDAWLEERCQGQPAVLAELRGMLPREEDSFLAKPAVMPPSALPPNSPPPKGASPSIGPYRLIRELGRGGMGVVYLAMRDDGTFRKNVALKLLLREQVTPEFVQRFRQERQVLAALDHPNIARILDGGDAPDGMPYYVMEYVDGLPIHGHCDEQRLTLTGRIGIFQQVCQAVTYLHNNSIVHRDLKPANILVSGDSVVKLLDFGIAKVVGAGSYSNADVTSVQGTPMTPTYASPEQVQGLTLQKTSDIYSLGVILYLLLTGHTPYGDWESKKAKLAAREDPPPPSANIREDLRANPESTAQMRKAMLGELDSIVLMALRYDPRDRYQSSAELSEDLQRFLSGHSVAAHRGTVAGRSVKLFRRKRAMVAVLAGFLLVGGFGAWQWRRVELQNAEIASREAQLRTLLDGLETGVSAAKPAAEKIKDLRALKQAFAAEFPKVAASRPEQVARHQALLERGVRYLDRVAALGSANADLGLELADAYQQMAVFQGSVTQPIAARQTYQKAVDVLGACEITPGDTRVADKLVLVRQRIQNLGGAVSSSAVPKNSVVFRPTAVGSVAPAARPQVVVPVEVPAASVAASPVVSTSASTPGLIELQERFGSVESRVVIAEQTIEPLKKTLEAQGQSLNSATLSDLSAMRLRLNQAKRQIAAGNEVSARESLVAAQALADRVLRAVGR